MQIDMHYYGTYALARVAGLDRETSELIATASQFVDDNTSPATINFPDGGQMQAVASGRHSIPTENISAADQRTVWVPFHFLPGGKGTTFTEKLVCQKNSSILQEMIEHHLLQTHKNFAPALIGVTAHVLADTFSHYNFSGVSSRKNDITQSSLTIHEPSQTFSTFEEHSLLSNKYNSNIPNIKASFEEKLTGTLGHAAAENYPDLPYLAWSYKTPVGNETIRRYNPDDYMEAAEDLYTLFVRFAELRPDLTDFTPIPFDDIQDSLAIIFASPGDKHQRSGFWQVAMEQKNLLKGRSEEIPPYQGKMWKNRYEELATCPDCTLVTELDVFTFYQAVALHKNYVLYDLLPAHDILVV